MALTDYDKKNLSVNDQKKIQEATAKWEAANAKGDKAGMAAAAQEAAAVRNNAGYKTNDAGIYTGSYSPTSSGGGSSYSGGSGGGTSKKSGGYSQYTAPSLGDTWDANTDYQAIISSAVANGDYVTAAKAEQLRNQKIIQTGSDYASTNLYKGWLDNTDYSIIAKNQMTSGAGWEDVLATYNSRYNKANGTVGLEQYKDDTLMQLMKNYIYTQQALENQQNEIDKFEQDNPRPAEPQSDPRIDRLLSQILNRDDFSYDANNDPLYQQYAEMYRREGDRAMRNTLAEAASGAGGMNTYAITAAQQANNYYNSQLGDKIPELYQLAYDMYLNDLELKVQDLGILQDMDATQYNRYRDTINDWYADKNFAYGAYQDAVEQGKWQAEFDYNAMLNDRNFTYNDIWQNKEWEDTQKDKELANSRYDQETAKEEVWKYISLGVTPSAELIAKAGMSETEVALAVAAVKAEQASAGT